MTALGPSTGCVTACKDYRGADLCGGDYAISLYRLTGMQYDTGAGVCCSGGGSLCITILAAAAVPLPPPRGGFTDVGQHSGSQARPHTPFRQLWLSLHVTATVSSHEAACAGLLTTTALFAALFVCCEQVECLSTRWSSLCQPCT